MEKDLEGIKETKDLKFEIENLEGPVLVDVFASWCGPCKMLAPVIEKIRKKYGESLEVLKIDIDKHQDIAEEYEIRSVPTLLFFCEKKLLRKEVGFMSESQICSIIDSELMVKNQ